MYRQNPPNFDRLARPYQALERFSFGRALARRRACFLDDARVGNARRALILGDGDGRFSAVLLERYPELQVTAVDASAVMLAELEQRVARHAPRAALELHCADLRAWQPTNAGYDLIVTHFFFDCLTSSDVAAMVARLSPAIAANASWLVSDFAIPARGVRALFARLLVRALYFAFGVLTGLRVTTLPEYEFALKSAGFACAASETALGGALTSELWQRSAAAPT
jgi:cyclopropane fatty-acyl-phospholipid synthase-like methyltransferase